MDLKSQLEAYQPFNEQEEKDRIEILRRLTSEEIYTRDNHGAHLTASAWVVSKDYALPAVNTSHSDAGARRQILLFFHARPHTESPKRKYPGKAG